MTQPISSLAHDVFAPGRLALFLDFDGTVAEIADRPDLVAISPHMRDTLARMQSLLDNAVAIVSGRDIDDVDRLMAPLKLAVSGVHGLERRNANGVRVREQVPDAGVIPELEIRLKPFVEAHTGLMLERKSQSLALHYRARPELESECKKAMTTAVADSKGVQLVHGKMVIEAKAGSSNKGSAIAAFMAEPEFAGRLAVFAGDDLTDEAAFPVVNRGGGVTIKVGPGETAARDRAAEPLELHRWLNTLADRLAEAEAIEQS